MENQQHRRNTETLAALQELIDVVAKLRSPDGGCPWDLAQTPQSLTPFVIEEAYEAVEAIQSGEKEAIIEELGDLLLQVILQAQIAQEYGQFTLQEIAHGIAQKLIRRHPHVFSNVNVENIEQVRQNWETIKASEKGETNSQKLSEKLIKYNRTFPPLLAALKISEKAAKSGFEWSNVDEVWAKLHEEIDEFKQAIAEETPERQQEELGDIIFALVQLARWHNLDPSIGLQGTSQRLIQRIQKMESVINRPFTEYTIEELDQLWQAAKAQLAKGN